MKYTADDLSKKLGLKVVYRNRLSVIDSSPSYALNMIRITNDFDGRISVNIDELTDLSCPHLGCRWNTKRINDDFCSWHREIFRSKENQNELSGL